MERLSVMYRGLLLLFLLLLLLLEIVLPDSMLESESPDQWACGTKRVAPEEKVGKEAFLSIDPLVLYVCRVSEVGAGRTDAVLSIDPLMLSVRSFDDNDSRQHLPRVVYTVIGISIGSVASTSADIIGDVTKSIISVLGG